MWFILFIQLSQGPSLLGYASVSRLWDEAHCISWSVTMLAGKYSWVWARKRQEKTSFSQESQSFLVIAETTGLHHRTILTFRWVK